MKTAHLLRLLLSATLLGTACSREQPAAGDPLAALPAVKVRVAAARTVSAPVATELTGVVRPIQRAQIAAKVMGTIAELPVTLGQAVRAGDLLVRISAGEISARVAQAQSQRNTARRDLERERDLLAKGASTAEMVRGLEDRLAAAEAVVHEAETMLAYTAVLAPFDGVVARKAVHLGDLASPGVTLLELESTDGFQVEVGIPDSLLPGVAVGTALATEVPATSTRFVGIVAELSSTADTSAFTVLAKLTVPPTTSVRSGQYARVEVPGVEVPALLVPAGAVSRLGQMERAFVVTAQNRAELRLVKTGATRGDAVEIVAGLDAGDHVVLVPPAELREGRRLEVLP